MRLRNLAHRQYIPTSPDGPTTCSTTAPVFSTSPGLQETPLLTAGPVASGVGHYTDQSDYLHLQVGTFKTNGSDQATAWSDRNTAKNDGSEIQLKTTVQIRQQLSLTEIQLPKQRFR